MTPIALDVRDRIVDFRRLPGNELQDHAGNWRLHPQAQKRALGGLLRQVGIVGALLVYYSERNGGKLTIIDGHLRKGQYPHVRWPCLITDLDDAEADLVLAALDPLAAMAQVAGDKLAELTARVEVDDPALQDLLNTQKAEADLATLMAQVEEQLAGLKAGAASDDGRGAGLSSERARVRPVVWLDDLADFERALRATGEMNRGEALAQVCRFYLEHHQDG